ncbi:MAG: spore germination protein, partial [Clostridia bacterium]
MPESTLEDRTHLKIASSLEYTLTQLRQIFRLPQNKDIVIRRMEVAGFAAALLYLDGMADQRIISLSIMEPCLQAPHYEGEISERMEWLRAHIVSASSAQSVEEMDEAVLSILRGDTLLLCEGSALGLLLETKGFARRAVEKPINDRVVMGAHEGFVESLRVNVTLIRRTIYSPRLVTETVSIGDRFPRSCALMYLDGIVNAQILAEVRRRIAGCRMDNIGGVGQLQQLIEDHPYALLPQMVHTERPDRAGSFLLAGQIVVLVDGSSTVLAMPISIFHLVHTPDDMFMRFQYSCFLRVIRYCGLLISLLLPAVYLSLIIHHKDVLPLSLITSIFENQARIPIPAFFELVLLSLV